jgi:predicted DNA-binding antitoxin AbrB/MazE fold protein
MKPIEAVFERGNLKPLRPLPLAEHQHVWLAILTEEPSARHLAELGERDPSFQFLAEPEEDLYSPEDGNPV